MKTNLRPLIRETVRKEYLNSLLEAEFQAIFQGLNILKENGKWTGSNTYEWDSADSTLVDDTARKTKAFLEKLPKEKIPEYFAKFIDKVKNLPEKLRKQILSTTAVAFLAVASLSTLLGSSQYGIDSKTANEFKQAAQDSIRAANANLHKGHSSFSEAQKHVKISEAGYSDDRRDNGNWVKVQGYGNRFVGSKYGISAPVLAKYLGKLPKAQDMKNLSYHTALKIYKKNYWDANNITYFSNQSIANILYDGCVNQGISGTKETLRKALNSMGVKITDSDDPFSIKWINTVNGLNQKTLFNAIKSERENRYKTSNTFQVHGKGWLNRLDSMEFNQDT